MMKLGFTLKKTKRNGLLGAGTQAEGSVGTVACGFETAPTKKEDAKVYVTDFDPTAIAPSSGDDGKPKSTLVIPLLKTNEWKSVDGKEEDKGKAAPSSSSPSPSSVEPQHDEQHEQEQQLTEDEVAAQQVLADVAEQNGDGPAKQVSTLVIPMGNGAATDGDGNGGDGSAVDSLAEKRSKLFKLNGEPSASSKKAEVPILQQNVVPGMDELADVTEKYRHDVALRPDELDVHSQAYDSVPIEDFGAAMLRGMGWKGNAENEKEDGDDPKPRQKLLGLGATAKPKLLAAGEAGKGRNAPAAAARRSDDKEKTRSNGLNSSTRTTSDRVERGEKNTSSNRDVRRTEIKERDQNRDRKSRDQGKPSASRSASTRRSRSHDRSRDRGRDRDRDREEDRRRPSSTSDRDREKRRDREERSRSREKNRGGRDRSSGERRDDRESRKRSRSHGRSESYSTKSSRR